MKIIIMFFAAFLSFQVFAQSTKDNIAESALPKEVRDVLTQYVGILREAQNLDDAAQNFVMIAGGGLVNENAEVISLRKNRLVA